MFQRRANSSGLESADTQQLLNKDTFDVGGIGFLRRWEQDSANTTRARWDFWWLDIYWPLLTPSKLLRPTSHLPEKHRQLLPPFTAISWGGAELRRSYLRKCWSARGKCQPPYARQTTLVTLEGLFFLWEDAEIPRELKPKDINLIYPPKSARLSWKFSRVNICQMFPSLMSCQSKPLWLQPPQAGPALFLPLVKIVATDKTQKQCWESRNFKF